MIWIALTLLIIGSVVLQGLAQIPAKPPHVALETWFGRRTEKVKGEGIRFFFLRGFVYNFILIHVGKIDTDFAPTDIRTPDLAELEVPISITYTPGAPNGLSDEREGLFLRNYIDYGGQKGVADRLRDIVSQELRQWAQSNSHPRTWRDALGSQDDVTLKLLHAIVGTEAEDTSDEDALSKLHNGQAQCPIPSLGITVNRLNVTNIKPKGKVAEKAEDAATEELERGGESVEMGARIEQANQFMESARLAGNPIEFPDALRFIMEFRAMTKDGGRGLIIPGLTEGLRSVLLAIHEHTGGDEWRPKKKNRRR